MTPEERFERIEDQVEKNTAGIRDLILVSRTVLTSIQELRDAQAATDEKLNILIDTVERIIRRENGNQS